MLFAIVPLELVAIKTPNNLKVNCLVPREIRGRDKAGNYSESTPGKKLGGGRGGCGSQKRKHKSSNSGNCGREKGEHATGDLEPGLGGLTGPKAPHLPYHPPSPLFSFNSLVL